MKKEFTDGCFGDTLDTIDNLLEDEGMLPKFHNEHCMYLYCTLERKTANDIIHTNIYNTPLTLYETPSIANAIATNLKEPVTLRIAVNLALHKDEYCYDQFTMQDAIIKSKYKVKTIEEYKSRCSYIRTLVTEPKSKTKVIQYQVFNASKLLSNPQYIE